MNGTIGQPHYDQVMYWVKNYGSSGADDKRAAEDYLESETTEKVKVLKGQLYAISQGKYDQQKMDLQVGVKRRGVHGSYQQWAKLMLLWLSKSRI